MKTPLEPKDIPVFSVMRNPVAKPQVYWVLVTASTEHGAWIAGIFYDFKELMEDGWEIGTDGVNWKPCSKEA